MHTKIGDFSKEDTFISWLGKKMNIKLTNQIGIGNYGVVYDIGDDKVIKLSYLPAHLFRRKINSPYVIKTYQYGNILVPDRFIERYFKNMVYIGDKAFIINDKYLSYAILEKVDTKSIEKDMKKLFDLLESFGYQYNYDEYGLIDDIITQLANGGEIAYIDDLYKKLNKRGSKYKKLFDDMVAAILAVKRVFPEYDDYHAGQFGIDKNGNLKIFDILPNDVKTFQLKFQKLVK